MLLERIDSSIDFHAANEWKAQGEQVDFTAD